ncbi:MAG: glycosyltransferase [Clostridia bacterium]
MIITHGGVGSIVNGVKLHKKVIAVPRYKKYGEVANDHQVQIINTFAKEGFIIGLNDVSELESALKEIENFKPKILESNTERIINIIRDFINNDGTTKSKKH